MNTTLTKMTAQALYTSFINEFQQSLVQRDHGYRTIQIGTYSQNGPQIRSVILRHLETTPLKLYFHTHQESEKIAEIKNDARTALHAYCPRLEKQIRFSGQSRILSSGHVYDLIAERMSAAAKTLYLDSKKQNMKMVVVEFTPESLDALWLQETGHLRIQGAFIEHEVSLNFVKV